METICKRFPHLAERIFDQVDDQSLNNCQQISEELLEYLESERFFWIRIIKKYQSKLKDFPELWKPVIDKTPTEIVKEIGIYDLRSHSSRPAESRNICHYSTTRPGTEPTAEAGPLCQDRANVMLHTQANERRVH